MIGLPVAPWGLLSHGLPYGLTALAVRLGRPEPDMEATYKLAAGVLLFSRAWVAEGWAVWHAGGGALLALFVAALLPSGFFALGWSDRLRRVARDCRAWLSFLCDRDLHRHLAGRRRAIMRDLGDLVGLVPASELSSTPERGA